MLNETSNEMMRCGCQIRSTTWGLVKVKRRCEAFTRCGTSAIREIVADVEMKKSKRASQSFLIY